MALSWLDMLMHTEKKPVTPQPFDSQQRTIIRSSPLYAEPAHNHSALAGLISKTQADTALRSSCRRSGQSGRYAIAVYKLSASFKIGALLGQHFATIS